MDRNSPPDSARSKRNNEPDSLFWGAIVLGLVLTGVGVAALVWMNLGLGESRLILCSGLGILFGAFGSKATVKYKGVATTGVAAIAIVLLYVVVRLTEDQITHGYIVGNLKGADISIIGDDTYLGAFRSETKRYEFIVPGERMKTSYFQVGINFPPPERVEGEKYKPGVEIHFDNIDKKYIEKVLGRGKLIEWHFDRDAYTLTERGEKEPFAKYELISQSSDASVVGRAGSTKMPLSVARARAADATRTYEEMFSDLRSGSAHVRRETRRELANRGVEAVKPMLEGMKQYQESYRVQLGVLVALTQMLRNDKSLAPRVSSELTDADIQLIVNAVSHQDRTIRIYAAEFLLDLDDKRILDDVLDMAKRTDNQDSIYLAVFLIKNIYGFLNTYERRKTDTALREIRTKDMPKTEKLIDSFVGSG